MGTACHRGGDRSACCVCRSADRPFISPNNRLERTGCAGRSACAFGGFDPRCLADRLDERLCGHRAPRETFSTTASTPLSSGQSGGTPRAAVSARDRASGADAGARDRSSDSRDTWVAGNSPDHRCRSPAGPMSRLLGSWCAHVIPGPARRWRARRSPGRGRGVGHGPWS